MRRLRAKGIALQATEQPIDTSNATGKALLDMLGVFAVFETSIRREWQMENVARAKARGIYKGLKPSIDSDAVHRFWREGPGATAIAQKLGIGRASAYRVLKESA